MMTLIITMSVEAERTPVSQILRSGDIVDVSSTESLNSDLESNDCDKNSVEIDDVSSEHK